MNPVWHRFNGGAGGLIDQGKFYSFLLTNQFLHVLSVSMKALPQYKRELINVSCSRGNIDGEQVLVFLHCQKYNKIHLDFDSGKILTCYFGLFDKKMSSFCKLTENNDVLLSQNMNYSFNQNSNRRFS